MTKIGITEAGDAGLDFSWEPKLFEINIIISKHLTANNNRLIQALLNNKNKIIFHCTCTGYGGTTMEPNVPKVDDVYDGIKALISHGFPISQIVLRTDPIIPTENGIKRVERVWERFSDLGIDRCRLSIIDMYPHVKKRFEETFGKAPFDTFLAPTEMIENVKHSIDVHKDLYKHFESCAENIQERVGCISQRDFNILGVNFDCKNGGFQRKGCLCVAGKTELLSNKKRCPSGCVYCYWH